MTKSFQRPTIFFGTRAISPPWDEGSKNVVYGLAQNLQEFDVILLTHKNQDPFPIPKNVKLLPIFRKVRFMVVPIKQKLAFFWAVLTTKADIYHFFFCPEKITAKILRWVKVLKGGIFIQTIPTPLESLDDPTKNLFGDWVVVQSQYSKKKLIEMGNSDALCIYPGIDTRQIILEKSEKTLRKELGLSSETKIVLYPGHYYLGCNDDLIDLVRANKKNKSNITFIFACRIAGERDIKLKVEIKKALPQEIESGLIILLDNVDSIFALMSLSDIIIFPPRKMVKKSEVPLALLEALALGKPIIITDIPPLNEIMKRDVGETVPPGNSRALINAVDKLVKNPSLRKFKGERGKEMVAEEFGISQVARSYAQLYLRVLGK